MEGSCVKLWLTIPGNVPYSDYYQWSRKDHEAFRTGGFIRWSIDPKRLGLGQGFQRH